MLCTESRAKKVVFCVFIVCFTFTLPTPFEWVVLERNSTETGRPYLSAEFSDLGQNDLYKTVYYYLNVILFALIPFLLLAIFNAFLIRSVHISHKKRNTMTQGLYRKFILIFLIFSNDHVIWRKLIRLLLSLIFLINNFRRILFLQSIGKCCAVLCSDIRQMAQEIGDSYKLLVFIRFELLIFIHPILSIVVTHINKVINLNYL